MFYLTYTLNNGVALARTKSDNWCVSYPGVNDYLFKMFEDEQAARDEAGRIDRAKLPDGKFDVAGL